MTSIVFTHHALMRYRRRIPARERVADLAVLVAAGEVRGRCPVFVLEGADAFLVHGEAIFPLQRDGDELVAVTCLRRRRRCKADIRAFREMTRDLEAAA